MKENNDIKTKIKTIGDELLLGQVINTNASWLGEPLNLNGFRFDSVLTFGDGEEDIMNALCSCNNTNDENFMQISFDNQVKNLKSKYYEKV